MTRTLALPELVDAPPADDPFRYGMRSAIRTRPDGSLYTENLPLTLWDVLHPQEGDHIAQSGRHNIEVSYLTDVIRARVARDNRALVATDLAVHWDTPGLSHHCPDVAVIFNIRKPKEQWNAFFVSQESARPELIIEVVSPHIREVDTVTKFVEYHAARVPMYVIVDREKEDLPVVRGYRWEISGYAPIAPDERGLLLLPMLGLCLGGGQARVTLYDAATGKEELDFAALVQALEVAKRERREAEERARLATDATPPRA